MISHFIGGTSKKELGRVLKKCSENKWIPILDYAREGSVNKSDVVTYIKCMKDLAGLAPVYALKISSFASFKPYETMDYMIGYLKNGGTSKILLDAENLAYENLENDVYDRLIRKYNKDEPFLYKTYQMYKSETTLYKDIQELPNLGIKLVRGAYYEQDFKTGKLYRNVEDTHLNYNRTLKYLLEHKPSLPVIAATHNIQSINLSKHNSSIEFAQLLGMKDAFSLELAKTHTVYKYVPYGTMHEMMPYLLRRLNENRGIIKHIF